MMKNDETSGMLAKDWRPQPEGQDAQPKWSGLKQTEQDRRMESAPEFSEWT
jgi:hypothetical protein